MNYREVGERSENLIRVRERGKGAILDAEVPQIRQGEYGAIDGFWESGVEEGELIQVGKRRDTRPHEHARYAEWVGPWKSVIQVFNHCM